MNDDILAVSDGLSFDDLTLSGNSILLEDQTLANLEGIEVSELTADNFVFVNDELDSVDAPIQGDEGGDLIELEDNESTRINLRAGAGNDTIIGSEGGDNIFGDGGNDIISGDSGDDFIVGGAGDDVLTGNGGVNTIQGGDW